jgi:hypothetical protein
MRRKPSEKNLRVAMHFVDGKWEMATGGHVPVAEGTKAEMIVPQKAILDEKFLDSMRMSDSFQILQEGATLYAYVVIKEHDKLSDKLISHLIRWPEVQKRVALNFLDNWSSGELCLLPVTIGAQDPKKQILNGTNSGGLWMRTKGRDVAGLFTSEIVLPHQITSRKAFSLNTAFTRISEVYEPWRESHTGNIYERFLYEEEDKKLYPLELLQDQALANQEQRIAFSLWKTFLARTSSSAR